MDARAAPVGHLELRRPPLGKGVLQARVRVAALSPTAALVLVEDLSEAHRIDDVQSTNALASGTPTSI
mgnify:CR=1 FL=1